METSYQDAVRRLLENPERLIMKKPFTRGGSPVRRTSNTVSVGEMQKAELPDFDRNIITQDQFLAELDPYCHAVLFDNNIPSITVKVEGGGYIDIKSKKMAIPIQMMILNKQVLHLCGYPTQFTLGDRKSDKQQKTDCLTLKQKWVERNQDGMRTKMVIAQKSMGDAGLLFYMDRKGRIKSRLLCYEDGYVICPHNDENGDRLLDSVYYMTPDGEERIDSYDDTMLYRHVMNVTEDGPGWRLVMSVPHGFEESPLVTHRGDVAWNEVQDEIEVFEIIYNVFMVIQKRHGWGILYIKGNFDEKTRKIAGAVILNDTSLNKDGSAQFLSPPSPQGMLDTLKSLYEQIQMGSGTTFILPKDISLSGDVSGVAVQIAQSLDNETALRGAIEWQNVISKMARLFKYGLGKELVRSGEDPEALTRFRRLKVNARIKPWRPRSDSEYNQMLSALLGAGMISKKTAIEKNTESAPDEEARIKEETDMRAVVSDDAAGSSISNTEGNEGGNE